MLFSFIYLQFVSYLYLNFFFLYIYRGYYKIRSQNDMKIFFDVFRAKYFLHTSHIQLVQILIFHFTWI